MFERSVEAGGEVGKRRDLTANAGVSRHLRWEAFEQRIGEGPPSVEAIAGSPTVHLFIEPAGRRIGARFFTRRRGDIPSPLAEVTIREIGVGSESALEVASTNQALYRDFYALCCSIADRVQIRKQPVAVAVQETLAHWSALLRRRSLLSEEREIGLLGELLFLTRTAKSIGWLAAAQSWLGPSSEEHDFVLPAVDVEVKSTTREERIHLIRSVTQLQPKLGRALYFTSIQLTRAVSGKSSFSLSSIVAATLSSAGRSALKAAGLIRDQIRRQGWEDEDAEHYDTRYQLRAPLMTMPVQRGFPAIVPNVLKGLGAEAVSRIEQVTYSIDVNGLGVADGHRDFERVLFHHREP